MSLLTTRTWLIGAAGLLAALLVASIIVVLLDSAEPLPEGTPEAVVQDFLRAVDDDEIQLAYALLSDDLKEECPLAEFAGRFFPGRFEEQRVTLERSEIVDGVAVVTVRVAQFRGGRSPGVILPLGPSDSSHEERYTLERQGTEWRFTSYPSPFFDCAPLKPGSVRPRAE